MEERVKICRACNAIVGWFALFCETCGAKQEPQDGEPGPGTASASAAGAAARQAGPERARVKEAGQGIDDEVRTHLVASDARDARAVARDLFQTQLRLIHRNREGVEELLREVEEIKRDLAGVSRGAGLEQVKADLDDLSERMFDTEQKWGELQVAYNRDSEMIEEESREHMEAADFDAYLSPDENAKVEGEYDALRGGFERADGLMREVGRDLALARHEVESRYLRMAARRDARRLAMLFITVALVSWSLYSALFLYQDDWRRVGTTLGPVLLALAIWVVFGFSARKP